MGKSQTFAGLHIAQLQPGDLLLVVVVHIFDHGIEQELNFLVVLRAFQHDLRSAEAVAAMNDRHLRGEARQEKRFLHGRIPAANHDNFFSGEKESVAGSARRNAVTDQLLLVRQSQPARRRATGDDQSLGVAPAGGPDAA